MNVDLSFMKMGRVAVNCSTQTELKILTEAIIEQHPMYEHIFRTKCDVWKYDHDDEGLAIRAILSRDETIDYGHCSAKWYREQGYKVINFSEISSERDLGGFESGFCDITDAISALFKS